MKKTIVCMVLCEGALFFYMIITQVLIYKYLKQFIFNLNFMFALNFDTKYFFEFFKNWTCNKERQRIHNFLTCLYISSK